jgi:predicted transposase/invertase (TIGR01784 family)
MIRKGNSSTEDSGELLRVSSDFVFKRLFGSESHRLVLKCLLNSILRGDPAIEDVELDNTEIARDREEGKDVRLDIRAKTPDGTIVTIEIQCTNRGEIINRSAFYQARLMTSELKPGESYDKIPDMISIWIADYPATRRKHHSSEIVYMYKGTEKDPIEIATSKFRTFIIELSKIEYKNIHRADMFSVWMMFIKHPNMIPREFLTIPEVNEAMSELTRLSHSREFRAEYEARQKLINDEYAALTTAREEGREKEKKEIALSMLRKGLSPTLIAECTGLSENEISELIT